MVESFSNNDFHTPRMPSQLDRANGGKHLQLVLTTLLLAVLLSQVFAQQDIPTSVVSYETVSVNNKTIYIRGGASSDDGPVIKQFYSLDLSPLLTYSNNLTWKKLTTTGPEIMASREAFLSAHPDNQAVMRAGLDGFVATYNVTTDTWSNSTLLCYPRTIGMGFVDVDKSMITDPTTGLLYMLYGASSDAQMLVYDRGRNTCAGVDIPKTFGTGRVHAWSESKYALYMMGYSGSMVLWEYQFGDARWRTRVSHVNLRCCVYVGYNLVSLDSLY